MTFYITPSHVRERAGYPLPEELKVGYTTWWDAQNALVAYCNQQGISPSNFWIDEEV